MRQSIKKFWWLYTAGSIITVFVFFGAHLIEAAPSQNPGVGGGIITTDGTNISVGGGVYATGTIAATGTISATGPTGNVLASGNLLGSLAVSYVQPGVFASGNFAFQSSLGVGYGSTAGLPQTLSVTGGGYFSGNVGVGTTTPGVKLHVYNNAAATHSYIRVENTQGGYQAALELKNSGTANADWIAYIPGSSSDLRFYRGSDLVTFQAGGNVGIGTTNPANGKLQVTNGSSGVTTPYNAGGLVVESSGRASIELEHTTTQDAYLFFRDSAANGTLQGYIGQNGSGQTPANLMNLYSTGGYMFNTSNVGIGVAPGTSKLTVAGVIESTTGGIKFPDGTTQTSAATTSTNYWARSSTNTTLANTGDNVGIGMTPSNKLHVSGNIGATGWIGAGCEGACESSGGYALLYGSGQLNLSNGTQLVYMNPASTDYTSLRVTGSLNSYSGIEFADVTGYGNKLMVHNTADLQGFWNATLGWSWYFGGGNLYFMNYGKGLVGTYSATRYQSVFAMGPSYMMAADGTSFYNGSTNFYGIAWTHENMGGESKTGLGHQALFVANGSTQTAIGYGVWTAGNVTAPAFYDKDNAAYYMDPAGTTNLNTVTAATSVSAPNVYATTGWLRNNTSATGLYNTATQSHFYSDSVNYWNMNVGTGAPAGGLVFRASYDGTIRGIVYSDGSNFGLLNNAGSWAVQIPNGGVAVNILGNLTVGGGTGKINAGTIDPIYTIDGKKFATYIAGMTGQKEETTGQLALESVGGKWMKEINFASEPEGSDLWLFSKATNIGKDEDNFASLVVILTPSFDGRAWYSKDPAGKTITIYGDASGEVSYRLTAPRFDSDTWTNYSKDKEEGFNLDKLIK